MAEPLWNDNIYFDWAGLCHSGSPLWSGVEQSDIIGQWFAGIVWDGIDGGAPMWLPPEVFSPNWATNSMFGVTADTTDPDLSSGSNSSRMSEDSVTVSITVSQQIVTEESQSTGFPEAPLSGTNRLLVRYAVRNVTALPLTNVALFWFLHAHPTGEPSDEINGYYNAEEDAMGFYSPAVSAGRGGFVVGMAPPSASSSHGMGEYAGEGASKPVGIVDDVEADTLSGENSAGPGEIAGVMRTSGVTIDAGATHNFDMYLWVARVRPKPSPNIWQPAVMGAYGRMMRGQLGM